jgi:hypothetical protein
MDSILESHLIDRSLLRTDDFDAFFRDRERQLLDMIGGAMGKSIHLDGSDKDNIEALR